MRFSNEQQPTKDPEPPGLSQERTREYQVEHFYHMLKLTLYTDEGVRQEWISPNTELGQETWQNFFQTELARADELGLTEVRAAAANYWKEYLFGKMDQDRTLCVRGDATSALVEKVRQVLLTTISFNLEQVFPNQDFLMTAVCYYWDVYQAHHNLRASLFMVDTRYNTVEQSRNDDRTLLSGLAPLISVTGVFTIETLTQIMRANRAMRVPLRRGRERIMGTARRIASTANPSQQDSQVSFPFPDQSGIARPAPSEYDARDFILGALQNPDEDSGDNRN